jgi:hypothetical protein
VPGLTKKDHNSSLQKALTILLEDKIKDQQHRASQENKTSAPQEERDKVAIAHKEFSVSTAKKVAEITRASDIDKEERNTKGTTPESHNNTTNQGEGTEDTHSVTQVPEEET